MMMEQPHWPAGSGKMAELIRSYDWAATPLGLKAAWPQPLRTMVEVMLASPMLASLAVGPERVFLYNDEAARHYGERHSGLLGHPLAEAFVHEFEAVRPFYDRVLAGESVHVPAQPLDPGRTGTVELFDAYLVPVHGADGAVIAAFMTGFAIGERLSADTRLRESEVRYRLLIGSVAQAVWETNADGVVIADSPTWRAYTGQTVEEWLGYGWLDAIHPEDQAYAERQWREATAVRGLVNAEFRLRAPDGRWRWTNVRAAPVLDGTGRVEKWAGMNIDIDVRWNAEAALRASEERFAEFAKASSAGLWIRDAATLSMEYVSPAILDLYGVEPDAILGKVEKWAAVIVPDDRGAALAHIAEAGRGKAVVHQFRIQRPSDRTFRWIRTTDFPLEVNGHVQRIGGIAEDVTEAKLAAEHSAALLAELQHRVRNIMALLRSITNRSAVGAESVLEYKDLMMGRLLSSGPINRLLRRVRV